MKSWVVDGVALAILGALALASGPLLNTVLTVMAVMVGIALRRQPIPRLVGCLAVAQLLPLWQLAMPVALFVWWLHDRRWPEGWRWGRIPLGWTALAAGVTPIGLVTWLILLRPDLGDIVDRYVPDAHPAWLVVGAVLFAVSNALGEEAIWRGVVEPELEGKVGVKAAILIAALSFGLQHAHGFPRGVWGMSLAAGWSVLLGLVRHRAGGLLAPFLAHLVADAVIAAIVLGWLAD
jgi:uncharacterized protein